MLFQVSRVNVSSIILLFCLVVGCNPDVVIKVPYGFDGAIIVVHQTGETTSGSSFIDTIKYSIPDDGVLCVSTPQVTGVTRAPIIYEAGAMQKRIPFFHQGAGPSDGVRHATGGTVVSEAGPGGRLRATIYYIGTDSSIRQHWNPLAPGRRLADLCPR